MYRSILILTTCTVVLTLGIHAQAGLRHGGHARTVCPSCGNCCTLKAERVKEDKACYEVECVEICIPRVVFPWQKWHAARNRHADCDACVDGCSACATVNNGARVKTVKRLKKRTDKCPACKYTWTPASNSDCGDGRCCGDNCTNGRAASACDTPPIPVDATKATDKTSSRQLPPRARPTIRSLKQGGLPAAQLRPVVTRSLSGG